MRPTKGDEKIGVPFQARRSMLMELKIAAKQLGWLKMEDFCPRCVWLMQRHPIPQGSVYDSPLSQFFRRFENFVQQLVKGGIPSWLSMALQTAFPSMPSVRRMLIPPTWSLRVGGGLLTGRPDVLWELEDGTLFIADYKLSQPSTRFAPLYETQLNAYALMAKRQQKSKVSHLALIYFELSEEGLPPTENLELPIKCTVQPVSVWDEGEVEALVEEMVGLLSQPQPPPPKPNCQRCEPLTKWAQILADWFRVERQ
ncbi:MAG: PD-(D/E)XK nuclease family protein [Armatimonadota bacterium]